METSSLFINVRGLEEDNRPFGEAPPPGLSVGPLPTPSSSIVDNAAYKPHRRIRSSLFSRAQEHPYSTTPVVPPRQACLDWKAESPSSKGLAAMAKSALSSVPGIFGSLFSRQASPINPKPSHLVFSPRRKAIPKPVSAKDELDDDADCFRSPTNMSPRDSPQSLHHQELQSKSTLSAQRPELVGNLPSSELPPSAAHLAWRPPLAPRSRRFMMDGSASRPRRQDSVRSTKVTSVLKTIEKEYKGQLALSDFRAFQAKRRGILGAEFKRLIRAQELAVAIRKLDYEHAPRAREEVARDVEAFTEAPREKVDITDIIANIENEDSDSDKINEEEKSDELDKIKKIKSPSVAERNLAQAQTSCAVRESPCGSSTGEANQTSHSSQSAAPVSNVVNTTNNTVPVVTEVETASSIVSAPEGIVIPTAPASAAPNTATSSAAIFTTVASTPASPLVSPPETVPVVASVSTNRTENATETTPVPILTVSTPSVSAAPPQMPSCFAMSSTAEKVHSVAEASGKAAPFANLVSDVSETSAGGPTLFGGGLAPTKDGPEKSGPPQSSLFGVTASDAKVESGATSGFFTSEARASKPFGDLFPARGGTTTGSIFGEGKGGASNAGIFSSWAQSSNAISENSSLPDAGKQQEAVGASEKDGKSDSTTSCKTGEGVLFGSLVNRPSSSLFGTERETPLPSSSSSLKEPGLFEAPKPAMSSLFGNLSNASGPQQFGTSGLFNSFSAPLGEGGTTSAPAPPTQNPSDALGSSGMKGSGIFGTQPSTFTSGASPSIFGGASTECPTGTGSSPPSLFPMFGQNGGSQTSSIFGTQSSPTANPFAVQQGESQGSTPLFGGFGNNISDQTATPNVFTMGFSSSQGRYSRTKRRR